MSWREEGAAIGARLAALHEFRAVLTDPKKLRTDMIHWVDEQIRDGTRALPAGSNGVETSARAAMAVSAAAGTLRFRALEVYEKGPADGMTDEEVGNALGHFQIWPRCSELRLMGLIQPTGATRRVERSNMECEVCAITETGRTVLAAERTKPSRKKRT